MTNAYSFEGLLACVLVFICSCVHIRRVRSLKHFIVDNKCNGFFSIFYKASVIGLRLQAIIRISLFS